MDEDALPTLSHATTRDSSSDSPLLNPRSRVKSPTSSSSPPLFSDDDPLELADITNYESPRDKRKRVGTWWENGPRGAPKRRQFVRNVDSGVHMMSDDSEASLSDSSVRHSFGMDGTSDSPSDSPAPEDAPRSREVEAMTASQRAFYDALQRSLNSTTAYSYHQAFNFACLGIQDEDLYHLRQLKQLVAVGPDADTEAPFEGQYRSMIPELHLSLGFNNLRHLDLDLFHLQNLVHLSLRNNEIEEIPLQIGSLPNLQTLDLCHNRIRTLPCELLGICAPEGNLTRLDLMGNPLCEVGDLSGFTYHDIIRRLQASASAAHAFSALAHCDYVWERYSEDLLARMLRYGEQNWSDFEGHHRFTPDSSEGTQTKLFLVTRTVAAYYDHSGRLLRGSPSLPMQEEPNSYPAIRSQPGLMVHTSLGAYGVPPVWFDRPSESRAPSLFTTALRTAFKNFWAKDVIDSAGEDLPVQVQHAFSGVEANLRSAFGAFRSCHSCGRMYLIPRAAWIEGWFFNHQVVPIKVMVCSWKCVPEIIARRPQPLQWMDVPGWAKRHV